MVLLIIIPFLNGYNWEYTLFSDKPICYIENLSRDFPRWTWTTQVNQTGLMWELAESFGALLVFAEHRCEPKSHGAFCGKGAARNCVGLGVLGGIRGEQRRKTP